MERRHCRALTRNLIMYAAARASEARKMVAAQLEVGVEPIQWINRPEGDSDVVGLQIKVVSKVSEPHPISRCGRKMAKPMWLRQ
jgi:hypothetical protein